jgi:hypothetical protein
MLLADDEDVIEPLSAQLPARSRSRRGCMERGRGGGAAGTSSRSQRASTCQAMTISATQETVQMRVRA